MQSEEIRKKFLSFFESRGYKNVPSASLVPEVDSSTLFINSGMQPLVPYLLGQKHPSGNQIVNIQKCWRTGDIDEVGDNTHNTFFEMLGRWEFGAVDKKKIIKSTYEFLTSSDGLGLDSSRLYASIFAGNNDAPKDEESASIWESLGVPYYYRGAKDNWWSSGDSGPSGPDSEVFYDVTKDGLGILSPELFQKADDSQQVIEIWNDVFMEYKKLDGKVVGRLSNQNVDTGVGLERTVAIVQGKDNIFESDLFEPLIEISAELSSKKKYQRIISDHIRSAVFAIADGVVPSNTDRGYVVRRLLRRSVMNSNDYLIDSNHIRRLVMAVVDKYGDIYEELNSNSSNIISIVQTEIQKFTKTLDKGLREFEKITNDINAKQAFDLYQSYGFPVEMTQDLAHKKGMTVDVEGFATLFKAHQKKSRTSTVGKFRGGLADHGSKTICLHTAHHLLLAALQKTLGKEVKQRGSNITPDRLRIDFSFNRKLTEVEKNKIEKQVNKWINEDLTVEKNDMAREDAEKIGAEMEFGQKYGDVVSVYFILDTNNNIISKEFCGGPHVKSTKELGRLIIQSEKASSAGVRRLKATLQSK